MPSSSRSRRWPGQIRQSMTVPGVTPVCAATFMAAIGEPWFLTSRKLVAYLGLDPKVPHRSGQAPARSGRISKRGSARRGGRWSKPPGAWSNNPARCARSTSASALGVVTARRSSTARKLAVLLWCMLNRGEDCAHQRRALTRGGPDNFELTRHSPRQQAARDLEHQPRDPARRTRACAPGRGVLPADGQRPSCDRPAKKVGASADTGARLIQALEGQSCGRLKAPDVCASQRQSPAPTRKPTPAPRRRPHRRG